jgi:hypothetical protein
MLTVPAVYARIAAYGVLVLALFFGGVYLEHRLAAARYTKLELGYAEAEAKAQAMATQETAKLQAKATQAQNDYENEHNALLAYVAANPVEPVRLCIASSRRPTVPGATGAVPGAQSGVAAPGDVLAVSPGDSGVRDEQGPDVSELLGLLALRADETAAIARESQSLEEPKK